MSRARFGASIAPGRRPVGRSKAAIVVALALGAAACSTATVAPGSASSPAPTATPVATITASPTTGPAPTASPSATAGVDEGGSPPAAALAGLAGGVTVAGDLGSFTWDGMASDGPWIVERVGARATIHARLTVTFAGGALPRSWTASWALIRDASAGTPVAAGEGHGAVSIRAPDAAGSWSLRLVASFGDGRSGTWFWRLAAGP